METKRPKYIVPNMDEVRALSDIADFNVVSLFAGGGGSSTGYRMGHGKILAINEFVEKARETYHKNYPSTHIFDEDVRDLSGKMILDKLKLKRGELDILDGSPPCSAFSMAGKREKGWGVEKKYSDNKTQVVDDLFYEYIRLVDDIQPKVFVAENVQGLTIGIAKNYLSDIKVKMRAAGYYVEYRILNGADYGVPQTRRRVIFIGVRKDIWDADSDLNEHWIDLWPKKTHPTPEHWVTLREALVDVPLPKVPPKPHTTDKKAFILWQNTIPGDQFSTACARMYGKASWFSAIRLKWDKPVPTITTSRSDFWLPDEFRNLTIEEMKRVFSVPDDYINEGTINQQFERLGRMVVPFMYREVSKNIYNVVLKPHNERLKNGEVA